MGSRTRGVDEAFSALVESTVREAVRSEVQEVLRKMLPELAGREPDFLPEDQFRMKYGGFVKGTLNEAVHLGTVEKLTLTPRCHLYRLKEGN